MRTGSRRELKPLKRLTTTEKRASHRPIQPLAALAGFGSLDRKNEDRRIGTRDLTRHIERVTKAVLMPGVGAPEWANK
jgi:hypothetical protein